MHIPISTPDELYLSQWHPHLNFFHFSAASVLSANYFFWEGKGQAVYISCWEVVDGEEFGEDGAGGEGVVEVLEGGLVAEGGWVYLISRQLYILSLSNRPIKSRQLRRIHESIVELRPILWVQTPHHPLQFPIITS